MRDPVEKLRSGIALQQQGRAAEAEAAYREVLACGPANADAMHLLGVLRHQAGDQEDARRLIGRAIALNPSAAVYHNNMGEALRAAGKLMEALVAYAKAIELRPIYPDAYSNLGLTLADLGRPADALPMYAAALEQDPAHPRARWNLSLALLLLGDWANGWRQYESRWSFPEFPSPRRSFDRPPWDGSSPAGRTILLHCEQGLGDSIQFIRFASTLADRGARVVVECPAALTGLVNSVRGVASVATSGGPLPAFDCHAPLLSMPLLLGITLDAVPAAVPYLSADAPTLARWRNRLAALGDDNLRVGLVWAGSPTHGNDRNRSIALSDLAPLAGVPGVTFVSLQKGPAGAAATAPPEGMRLIDLAPSCTRWPTRRPRCGSSTW